MCRICEKSDISYQENKNLKDSLGAEKQNAKRGLLCAVSLPDYDPQKEYQFLEGEVPEQYIHPNLLEQARLNKNYGLFKVFSGKENNEVQKIREMKEEEKYPAKPGDVFQIRGYDLASMTLVYDENGWIVMDVLTTSERAKSVWEEIVTKRFDDVKIHMVIYSHSHIDHYGGIGGLKEYFDEGCVILAPDGFTKHAVSENVYVGAAMTRRAVYQYGSSLEIGWEGCVDCGLGKAVSKGTNTILVPTQEIGFGEYLKGKKYCIYNATQRELLTEEPGDNASGGLILQMQYTPGTEAPAEMNVYLPGQKILFIAENCAGTLHNTLTPRGAQVRDPLAWAGFLDETLAAFPDLETVCSAHNWPHFGHEDSVHFIEIQRDMYRYLNNATLHLVNLGYTIDEVGRMVSGEDGSMPLPEDFAGEWCCHGFYGTYNHDAKAVYQRYMGWYDGNPAHLNRHKPADRATRYVKAFGAQTLYEKAALADAEKDYAWAAELLDYLLNADMGVSDLDNVREQAISLYASVLKQMGYASQSPSWRNMYLTGAQEAGGKTCLDANSVLTFPNDTVEAMTLEMILQYLGIMLDSKSLKENLTRDSLVMHITVKEKDAVGECAEVKVNASRGVLDYRIVSEAKLDKTSAIQIAGSKLSIFRMFVDHDMKELNDLIPAKNEQDIVKPFIINCLTIFPLNFPIMTPRKKY